jgi:hypothetical protein
MAEMPNATRGFTARSSPTVAMTAGRRLKETAGILQTGGRVVRSFSGLVYF